MAIQRIKRKRTVLIITVLLLLLEILIYSNMSKPTKWDITGREGKAITWGAMRGDYTSNRINELEQEHRKPFGIFMFIWLGTLITGVVVHQLIPDRK